MWASPIKAMADASIFVSPLADGCHQLTVFSCNVTLDTSWKGDEQPGVLVLPFPNPLGGLSGVDYVNLHEHPSWIEDAHLAFRHHKVIGAKDDSERVRATHSNCNRCEISLFGSWTDAKREFPWKRHFVAPSFVQKLETLYGLGHGFVFAEVAGNGPMQPLAFVHPIATEGRQNGKLFLPSRQANATQDAAANDTAGVDPFWDMRVFVVNCPNAKNSLGSGASPSLSPIRIAGGTWHTLDSDQVQTLDSQLASTLPEVSSDFYSSGQCIAVTMPPWSSVHRLVRYDRYKNMDLSFQFRHQGYSATPLKQSVDGNMQRRFPSQANTTLARARQEEEILAVKSPIGATDSSRLCAGGSDPREVQEPLLGEEDDDDSAVVLDVPTPATKPPGKGWCGRCIVS